MINKLTKFLKSISYTSLWLLMLGAFTNASFGQAITLSTVSSTINEDGGSTTLIATAATAVTADLTVTITYTGTSVNATDYSGLTTITILSGATTGTTVITGSPDTFLEGDETVIATITGLAGGGGTGIIGSPATQTITITDAESLSLTGGVTIAEDGGTTLLRATVSGGGSLKLNTGGSLTITLTYSGTAVGGTDYTNTGGTYPAETLTLANGAQVISTTITGSGDTFLEGDETIIATMTTAVTGLSIVSSPQTVTITDAESLTLTYGGSSTIGENGGATTLRATVSGGGSLKLNGGGSLSITLTYSGTGVGGTDYTNTGGTYPAETLTLANSSSSTSTTVTGVADTYLEGDETAIATMTTGVTGLTIGGSPQTVTITDAESLILTGGSTIAENGGTTSLTATVSGSGTLKLNGGGSLSITLTYTGTADAVYGTDFTNTGGADPETLTLTNASSSISTTVTGVADTYLEGDETAIATMTTGVAGLTIGGSPQTVTITDAESLILSGGTTIDEAGTATLIATVSGSPAGTLKLNGGGSLSIALAYSGTADATYGTDFTNTGGADPETLTLTNGSSSISTTITPVNDAIIELDETAIAAMTTGVTGLTVSGSPQTVTITDDVETVLLTPADAATGDSLNVALTWSSVLGANQYKLYVNTASNFGGTAIINGVDQGNVTNKAPGGLTDNTTYYWKVIPRNTGSSDTRALSSAEVRSFTTSQQSVSGILPVNNSYDASITPTLSWPLTTGANNYRLEVNTNLGFTGTVIFDSTTTGATVNKTLDASSLVYNTTYYWRVTASSNLLGASNGNGITTSATANFITLLATPQLTSPVDNFSSANRKPTLTWTQAASTSLVTYQLDYYFNGSGTPTTVPSSTIGSATSYTFPSDLAFGRYTWKITADDGAGKNTAKMSTIFTFDVVPTKLTPINGLTGVPIEPTFTWVDGGINTYVIQITTTSGSYGSPVVEKTVTGTFPTSYQMLEADTGIPLNNNTTYYWRLKVDAGGGNFVYSSEWQFTTIPAVTITLGNPQAGTVYTTSTMFTWSIGQATGTMKFKPQVVSASSSPTDVQWAAATLTATTSSLFYTFTLNGGTQYYWRIVLLNAGGEVIGYSSEITFTTSGGTTVTVTPSWPTAGVTVYTNSPTLYWYVNQYAPGVTYQARYSASSSVDGNGMLDDGSAANLATTSNLYATIGTALSPGATYYWQVRAYYATTTSYGSWTSPTSFVTNGSGTLLTPTASYPTGGVTVYTIAPTLYWYLSGSSTGLTFDVDYGTSVDGTPEFTGISTLYKALSGLTPGTTYQWRVRSNNGSGGTWSATETFVVSGGVTSSSTVATWPVSNPTMYTQKPTLSWYLDGSSLGVTGYKVKYSTTDKGGALTWAAFTTAGAPDGTDGEVTISGSTTTTWTATSNLTYGQKYYWAVASWDGTTAGTYSTGSFTIAGGSSSGSVVLSSPIGGVTITTKSPTLYWYFTGSTLGITGYKVAYSDNGGLTSWTYVTTTSLFKALSGLTAGATYTWKVSPSWDGATYPSYSTATTFVVDPSATTIVPIVGGPNNVTINTSVADVSWILPTAPQGNLTYELVFADNAEMTNARTITTTDVYSEVSSLQSNKNYYWKVRSVADNGSYSSYSNVGTFKTDDEITAVGGDKETIPAEFKLSQNYPNPFNPSTVIEYSLPEASYVSMKIYNVLGREVRTLISGSQNAGNYQTQWNGLDNAGNKVATGMYIYRITTGSYVATKKMLLLK